MATEAPANGVTAALASPYIGSTGQTTCAIASTVGWTDAQYHCLIADGTNNEIVLVTGLTGSVLTIVRHAESWNGSSASYAFGANATITVVTSVQSVNDLISQYADLAVGVETSRAEAAEALLAPLASPALTGTPTAPTQTALSQNTDVATTAYADLAVGVETSRAEAAEALKVAKAGDTMTGPLAMGSQKITGLANGSAASDAAAFGQIPAVPTAATTVVGPDSFGASAVVGTGTTFARADHNHGLPAAPAVPVTSVFTRTGAITAAAGDYTVSEITGAAPLASPALTGTPTAPTATALTNDTQLSTTAYTDSAVGVETTRAEAAEALKIPLSTVTTAGDLIVASGAGAVTRLGVGSAGQVLEVVGSRPAWTTPSGGGALATAREVAIGTSITNVITYTPASVGNFVLGIYFRVITATTNVTVTVTWTDATGAQTLTVLSAVPEVVGSYSLTTFMVDSTAAAITIAMTAGTASQVYGSATILQG